MLEKLAAAISRFADRSNLLHQLILQNPDFRSLCEDYGEAVAAFKYWSTDNNPVSSQRKSEYLRLIEELESDIRAYLEEQKA